MKLLLIFFLNFNLSANDRVIMFGKVKSVENDLTKIELYSKTEISLSKNIVLNFDFENLDYQYFEVEKSELKNINLINKGK